MEAYLDKWLYADAPGSVRFSAMTNSFDLIPELSRWNNGNGIALADWIFIEGRADHALGFCSLLWPDFQLFEGYVLRGPIDVERLRGWEQGGHSRQEVEAVFGPSM